MAARFYRSVVGAVAFIRTAMPAAATGPPRRCTQKSSPTRASVHSCTIVWLAPSVRGTALSQSFHTAKTQEPATLDVTVADGAPLAAEAVTAWPVPEAPFRATTVSDWS